MDILTDIIAKINVNTSPIDFRDASTLTYTSAGIATTTLQNGTSAIARGVDSKIDGTLSVHLIGSYTSAGTQVFCDYPVYATTRTGMLFDAVSSANSTSGFFTSGNLKIWF